MFTISSDNCISQVGLINNQLLDTVFGDGAPSMHIFFMYMQSVDDPMRVFGHYNVMVPAHSASKCDGKNVIALHKTDARKISNTLSFFQT